MGSRILGCGSALPALRVTNDDLSRVVDTSDEWIAKRTGIRARHIAVEETATDLGVSACQKALEDAGVDAGQIDLIVCTTGTPDALFPSQAALIRAGLGAVNAVCFDLNAACAGCVYALTTAHSLLQTMPGMRRALVVGSERMSRAVDWTDRATCVLFGDGAGAVVLERCDDDQGVLASVLKNEDDVDDVLRANSLYAGDFPFTAEGVAERTAEQIAAQSEAGGQTMEEALASTTCVGDAPLLLMKGREVFKFATRVMPEVLQEACDQAGVAVEDLAVVIPHQANERIISYAAKKLGLPLERFHMVIQETGNTSSASVFMALDDARRAGRIQPGQLIGMTGFGAGLTAGAVVLRA
ncbi:MAG: beta-ketoacyl-ACP synthase III [Coriobacteriia bacterium]|nr:beta-ketoacyl-ACP synthase III [Coriobacteriia bacterium]